MNSSKWLIIILYSLLLSGCAIFQLSDELEDWEIENIFEQSYNNRELSFSLFPKSKIDSVIINRERKIVDVHFDKNFSSIPFRPENVDSIYKETEIFFSEFLEGYKYRIFSLDLDIEYLIPNYFRPEIDKSRIPKSGIRSNPIVYNSSKDIKPFKGLFNRNVALWHSHGWYYNHRLDRWLWQRARLFQTVEDLGPMSLTIPFLIPMLENSGANVFVPTPGAEFSLLLIFVFHQYIYYNKFDQFVIHFFNNENFDR
jgi:hypothetical protein